MSDFTVSHIRTFVPILVGAVVTVLAGWGLDVDSSEATVAITGAVIAAYYALVRALAQKWPSVGILLGVNKAPSYEG